MTGDLVFDEHVPTFDGSTLGWISVLESLRAYDCRGIIPGHGKAYVSDGWTQPIDAMLTYLNTVVKDVRAFIARNATIDEAVMQAGQSQKKRLGPLRPLPPRQRNLCLCRTRVGMTYNKSLTSPPKTLTYRVGARF